MTEATVNQDLFKSKGQVIFEYILLTICLCVIALRVTFTESPNSQSTTIPVNLGDTTYSLSISAILIFSFVIWFVWSFCISGRAYRFTSIEIGLCLFTLAAIAAGLAASDKRLAITNFVVAFAPPLFAILLVQILDSHTKIKLLLVVIAALGIVSAYECVNQLLVTNKAMIAQYQKAPQTFLAPLGITPGSLRHWQLEHRLYSKDIKGFFTTSNSAGSFALLAFFAAIALFLERFKSRRFSQSGSGYLLLCGIAVATVLFGLAITQSKGAIAASLIAAAMFIAYILFGSWLKTHKKAILISCLLLAPIVGCIVVWYGLTHGRLPGGNSMLVRWQYWSASAKMYGDHPLLGIGPGNFHNFYTRYKFPSALEEVSDPHNFLLSIITQYGPVGLVGFLAMVLLPLWRTISPNPILPSPKTHPPQSSFVKLAIPFAIAISAGLLIIRPIIMPLTVCDSLYVMTYSIFTLYIAPPVAFAVAFWFFMANGKPVKTTNTSHETKLTNITRGALFCACLGLLLHNLIDFAIFEPGVSTAFWAIVACLIAMDFKTNRRPQVVLKPPLFAKVLVIAGGLIIIWAYLNYCLIPVAQSTARIAGANKAISQGDFEKAHNLLDTAADDDCLSPAALNLNGRLYLQRVGTFVSQIDLLLKSVKCLSDAARRNPADFKNFEQLATAYTLMAEIQPQQRQDWLNKAFANASFAVERYPGSSRLRIQWAQIAEQLGKTDIAIVQYKMAVDVEDGFRRQFQIMYPGYKLVSRLGQEEYEFAKQRIKELSKSTTP